MRAPMFAVLIAVAFAGCTTDAPAADPLSNIPPGRGVIHGYLVDDRYEAVANATMLLLPIGRTATTDEEGQYMFLDLKPGRYELRISAEGHEGRPASVEVVAGKVTPADMMARRTASDPAGDEGTREVLA